MLKSDKQIEIEYRARFDETKYDSLNDFLSVNAEDLGMDDKDVCFFLLPDKLLKTVNNVSKKNAKIVLKLNKIGMGSDFEEIEVPIGQEYFEATTKLFLRLGIADSMRSYQKRHNFLYKEVELALKWSQHWGHHLELEIVVSDLIKKEEAENKIFLVAKELGVELMTDEELLNFTKSAEAEYRAQQ